MFREKSDRSTEMHGANKLRSRKCRADNTGLHFLYS